MSRAGYGVACIDAMVDRHGQAIPHHASLTESLGCSETSVDAYRCAAGHAIPLQPGPEQLCIPFGGPSQIMTDGSIDIPTHGLGFIPSGMDGELTNTEPVDWLVVSLAADRGSSGTAMAVNCTDIEFTKPSTSSISTARLTARLGCVGMKVNARRLEPGDRVPYHTEGRQEELFIPRKGRGTSMLIAGETVDLPVGWAARVPPETPRAAMNTGENDSIWIMVGAPPTGDPDEWDPGAEIVEWPEPS